MARTVLAAQQIVATGLEPVYTAANADGHFFENDGNTILHVKNGSGADVDVTLQTPATQGGLAVAEQVVTVTAGEERFIGRLLPALYNRPTGGADAGKVYVDFEAVDTVTVALLEP